MNALLQAAHITKTYTGHRALDRVSMKVPEQSIFGLLGPNGAGKTTLIRIINQIIGPDEGQILLDGEKLTPRHVRQIGYLPEERGLYKKMQVGEQAEYLARLKGLSRHDARKLLKKWFDRFDLTPWWHNKVEELSKGMQQKVQFIITVLHKPRLLIFDEPFTGFDPINVNILKEEILKLRQEGATIIFSTHNMASVEELCDHIALINKSQKIVEGNVQEIKQQHTGRIYEVELSDVKKPLENLLDGRFRLIKSSTDDHSIQARIKILNDTPANDLLQVLIREARLAAFKELTPSMNDIFIKNVTGRFPAESNAGNKYPVSG